MVQTRSTFAERYIWGGPKGQSLEWQPYDGSPLPRHPVVSSRKITDDYRSDAYTRRPGVSRRRHKKPTVSPCNWYDNPSTNRLLETQVMQPPKTAQQRATQLDKIRTDDVERTANMYHRQDEEIPRPITMDCPRSKDSGCALRWRLCPWAVPGELEAVPSLAVPGGLVRPLSTNGLTSRPGTNGFGDPRAGFGYDCTANLPATSPTNRLPPLEHGHALSPTITPCKTAQPIVHGHVAHLGRAQVRSPPGSPTLCNSPKQKVSRSDELLTQYDLFKAQATECGVHSPHIARDVRISGNMSGYDVFSVDFRDRFNSEHPELSDVQHSTDDSNLAEYQLPISDALLLARRNRIESTLRAQWLLLSADARAEFDERAQVLSEPPPATIEQLLAGSKFSWEELNVAREWWSHQAESDVRSQRLALMGLEGELNKVSSIAKQVECTVIDEFNPMVTSPKGKKKKQEEDELAQQKEMQDSVEGLNALLRQRHMPNKSSATDGEKAMIFNGGGGVGEIVNKVRKPKGRRRSLNLTDLTWSRMSSLQQSGVAAFKRKIGRKHSVDSTNFNNGQPLTSCSTGRERSLSVMH